MYASKQKLSENISSLVSSVICSIDNDLKLTAVSNHNLQYYNKHSSQHLSDVAQNFDSISPELVYEGRHIYDRQFHNYGSTLRYMTDNSSRVHKFTSSN